MLNPLARYFTWLQKDNPVGVPDRLPELHNRFQTSIPGVYCAGDLTGIPLIKMAAESGWEVMESLRSDPSFHPKKSKTYSNDLFDVVIIGGGPSGISAAMRAHETGLRYLVLESAVVFSTIKNFPKAKPIYVTPANTPFKSGLQFTDGAKETLLEQLQERLHKYPLNIHENETVTAIQKADGAFKIKTDRAEYSALRVIVAIGKTGAARRLAVFGADLPKVFTRLIDPFEYSNKNILVVGGGDSAVEASIALAKNKNHVTLSYRGAAFFRIKEHNQKIFGELAAQGKITPIFNSIVAKIDEKTVTLSIPKKEMSIENDIVYVLIGSEIPYDFFKRANIKIAGKKNLLDYSFLAFMLLFSACIYFGKSGPSTMIHGLKSYFILPLQFIHLPTIEAIKGLGAFIGASLMVPFGLVLSFNMIGNARKRVNSAWNAFKFAYLGGAAALFTAVYVFNNLRGTFILGLSPDIWYSSLYALTMLIFGLRRMYLHPTGYIVRQTACLIGIQLLLLFFAPFFIVPWLGSHGHLGPWIMNNIFPGGSYWRSFGFILAWPLFIYNCATGQPTAFWLWLSFIQSFALIPLIVQLWGKGAYCGWICPCGGLAETLGDEHREKAPHGPMPKRMENAGQIILAFAFFATLLPLLHGIAAPLRSASMTLQQTYSFLVDLVLAGIVGFGVYFFFSGRLWCRFLCPLAALMHIYARFTRYRIFANKKRCISCNICTKVCHMGIDVMNFANKGLPMNDVECVRCSACIINCPLQVLTFGSVGPKKDMDAPQIRFPLTKGWRSGLPKDKIRMLLEEEKKISGS